MKNTPTTNDWPNGDNFANDGRFSTCSDEGDDILTKVTRVWTQLWETKSNDTDRWGEEYVDLYESLIVSNHSYSKKRACFGKPPFLLQIKMQAFRFEQKD